ncbi:MAG TPA: LysM peptidoglycan-binding domain-containing protein [Candidatus Acetothermia bacterium]|nr:LysM peptidoglycan-binding domain-containing protein [Candidatus Acetothermia bacterium]
MAVMVLLAVIILPLVFRSGRSRDAELQIEDGSGQVTSENGQAAPTEDDPDPLDAPVVPAVGRFRSHVVQDGETLAQVAGELGVSTEHVMASNRLLSGSQLRPGQTVYATDEGLVHTIQAGQTLSDISKSYNAIPLARLMEANGLRADSTIFAGDRILIPGVSTSFWRHAVSLARGQAVRFIWPMEGPVRSEFGWRDHPVFGVWHHHDGIDIDVPEGTAVHAAASGKVFFYGEQPGYGNLLIIEHADGFYSFYGHLLRATVSVGQFVEMGQTVAQSGNTGDSTGPHLHFEIRNREYPVDPRLYLPSS